MRTVDQMPSYVGAFAMGANGTIVFAMLPILLGLMAQSFDLSEANIGALSSTYFGSYTIVTLTSPIWVRRFSWKAIGILSNFVLAVAMASPILFQSIELLFGTFVFAGFGAGAAMALSMCIVSEMTNPDRKFAIKIGVESFYGAVLLFSFPTIVLQQFGYNGFWMAFSAVLLIVGLCAAFLPPTIGLVEKLKETSRVSGHILPIAGLFCLMLFFGSVVAVYVFVERIGQDAGISLEATAGFLALSAIMGVVGPFAAAALNDRWGRVFPQVIGTFLVLICFALLTGVPGEWRFGAAVAMIPLGWYFGLAFQNGIVASADVSGRYASLMAAALAVGATFGPGIGGLIIESKGYETLYGIVGAVMIVAVSGFWLIVRRLKAGQNGPLVRPT